jgi:hypothetical protein
LAKPPYGNKPGAKQPAPSPATAYAKPQSPDKRNGAGKRHRSWLEIFAVFFAALAFFAAGYQGWVIRDSEQRQLRAYVGLVPGGIDNFDDIKNQHFVFIRKNYGQTPAYDVALTELGESVLLNGQPLPVPMEIGQPPEILRGGVTLFPTGELPMNVIGVMLAKEQIDRVLNDINLRFIYAGTIKYRDAFDNTHFTNFCWMYKKDAMNAKDVDWCQGHNDSD